MATLLDSSAEDGKGYNPHPNGWTVSQERMEQLNAEGQLYFPKKFEGRIQLKRYLDELRGMPVGTIWINIPPVHSMAAERLGYPTQKPVPLLEHIINASSNPGAAIVEKEGK